MPPTRLCLLLLLVAPCVMASRCEIMAKPLNVLLDTNGDGFFDSMHVSDYDGDGRLEIVDDLQAALDALDDPGPKHLEIGAGTFLPPTSCPVGSPCWCRLMPRYNSGGISCHSGTHDPRGHALLQVGSDTTLSCVGRSETVLALWEYDDPNGGDANFAAIGNADYDGGNRNITIEDCDWRGGGRAPYDSRTWLRFGRRGLDFHNVEDVVIQRNHASYFAHAGIFVESSRRVAIRDNVLERDGGFGNLGNAQSSIYIHNDPVAPPSADIVIERNTLLDPGGNAISLRNDYLDAGKWIERVVIRYNSVYSHGTGTCILMRGSRQIEVRDYYCEGTLFGFSLDPFATAFGSGNVNDGVLVDGLTLVNIVAPSGGSALFIAPYHSNVSFRNVVVDGTTGGSNSDCMAVRPPFRNVTVQGFVLRNCGGNGIQFYRNAVDPSIDVVGRTLDERLLLWEGLILDVDASNRRDWSLRSGILFSTAGARGLMLNQILIDGVTGHGIEVSPGVRLEDSFLNGLDISRVPPRFRGMGPKASHGALVCDAASADDWIHVTDAGNATDCNLAGASGVATARCRCEDGAFRPVTNHGGGHMIALEGGTVRGNVFSNLYLHENAGPTPDFAFQLDGGTPIPHSGNRFEGIQIADDLDGHTYGIRLAPGGADATNQFAGIYCEGSAAARCLEGVPPGAVVLP